MQLDKLAQRVNKGLKSQMENVAAIILNYKSWNETIEEIDILHKLFHLSAEQIIVIDNNSPNDSSIELNKRCVGSFRLLQSSENKGYASGNNIGLKAAFSAGYKYALVLNNDIIFEDENSLLKLKKCLETDDSIGAISPDVYYPDGKIYNRNSIRPNFWDMTLGIYSFKKRSREIKNLGDYGYVYRPQGCCMMVDLAKMSEIEFLDEHTFLYSEESILAERLLKKGYKCAVCTSTSIIHNHSVTVKDSIQTKEIEKIRLKSHNYLLREYRHYPEWMIKIANVFDKIIFRLTS